MTQSLNMAKFEQWQIDDAHRLRKLVDAHLVKEGITQAEFTARCGFSTRFKLNNSKAIDN